MVEESKKALKDKEIGSYPPMEERKSPHWQIGRIMRSEGVVSSIIEDMVPPKQRKSQVVSSLLNRKNPMPIVECSKEFSRDDDSLNSSS